MPVVVVVVAAAGVILWKWWCVVVVEEAVTVPTVMWQWSKRWERQWHLHVAKANTVTWGKVHHPDCGKSTFAAHVCCLLDLSNLSQLHFWRTVLNSARQ